MKTEEREEARALRANGQSIIEIARKLNVAKSSVSTWVRDIPLSDEQRTALIERNRRYGSQTKGAQAVAEKFRKARRAYQAEGRTKAKERDWLHAAGCMIYWAEGRKQRNFVGVTNSDPNLLRLFVRFLKVCFGVTDSNLGIRINCYTNNGLSQEEIEAFWLRTLELPRSSLRKSRVNLPPRSSLQKAAKQRTLLYGVCTVELGSARVVQHIFGAIQAYGNFENKEWLG